MKLEPYQREMLDRMRDERRHAIEMLRCHGRTFAQLLSRRNLKRKGARIMEMQRRSYLRQDNYLGLPEPAREFFAEQARKFGALARKFRGR